MYIQCVFMYILTAVSKLVMSTEGSPLQVGIDIRLYLSPIPLLPTLMCMHTCAHTHIHEATDLLNKQVIGAAGARVRQCLKQHLSREQIAPQIIQFPIFGEHTKIGRTVLIYK